jgi:hypothetical protein
MTYITAVDEIDLVNLSYGYLAHIWAHNLLELEL